jgi:two-component SAPR family response regulator
MTKEEVGVIFWPDSSIEELKRRFKNAIYRMRRAIGSNAVIFNDNYYRFNNTLDFEYDVLSFEQNISQAENETNFSKKIKLYEAAVELYKGPFLADVDATWFAMERQRYLEMYLATLQTLFNAYINQDNKEKAPGDQQSDHPARTLPMKKRTGTPCASIMSSATRQGSSAFMNNASSS